MNYAGGVDRDEILDVQMIVRSQLNLRPIAPQSLCDANARFRVYAQGQT